MEKVIIIGGPTAVGKTKMGIYLAKTYNGEIISADSRQVYKGMDIGTGKDIDKNIPFNNKNQMLGINNPEISLGFRMINGIPIWLIDAVDPDYRFNVGEYKKLAEIAIRDIISRNKVPIVVGGTGLYIKSLIHPMSLISIPPNFRLRKILEKKSRDNLGQMLKKNDIRRWKKMNRSDRLNPVRLIRAIEICEFLKKYNLPECRNDDTKRNVLFICLFTGKKNIKSTIDIRIKRRLEEGLIDEIKALIAKGYSFKDSALGRTIGYQEWEGFFSGYINADRVLSNWRKEEYDYADRQYVWFKKAVKENKGLWFDVSKKHYIEKIEEKVRKWYTSSRNKLSYAYKS